MRRFTLLSLVLALLLGAGTLFVNAQGGGGAFVPGFAYNYVPRAYFCGTSSTCANTNTTPHLVAGFTTLAAGVATVSGITPAFTSSSTFVCTGTDTSGGSGVLAEVVPASGSSITLGGTGAGTVAWICSGY